jgi:ribosome-associated protein
MSKPAKPGESQQRFADRSASDPRAALDFAVEAARLLADDKCENVLLLDVREFSQVTDFILIATGTSERQMRSVLKNVGELGQSRGFPTFRSSDDDRATWLLADFVDVVVHVFEPNTRAHYDLEMLWGDAPHIAWERPGDAARNRAGLKAGERLE